MSKNKKDSYKETARSNISRKPKGNDFLGTLKFLIITGFACILAGAASLHLYLSSLEPINNLEEFKPNIVTQIYAHDGEVIKNFKSYTFEKIELKDIPDNLKKAIIATEDKNFYKHNGYDLMGLARSTVQNIISGRLVQGASTITQQLSRVLFLSNEKTLDRKLKELFIAARIEKTLSKDQILEMYLNNVYLGSGAYGVEGASQIYFGKSLKDCDLAELALIAGLPQAPSVYSPFNNVDLAIKRRNQVLMRMYKMRYITKTEYENAKTEKVKLTSMPDYYTTNKAPYFCDYVMKELDKLGFDETEIIQGGYKIITTLDYKTQIATNEAIIKNMNNAGLSADKHQAALFSFSPIDGRILAYAGGKDYAKSQFDRVTLAVRPPGSAFKPIVYAAALEAGVSPNDMILDAPVKIGGWTPKNYGNKYRGKIPVYTALMVSSNTCAARMIAEIGIKSVIQTARVLGINTPLEFDYTICLGSNGVRLFELTRAFGAFANGGYVVQPYAVERVETSRGKIVYKAPKAKVSHQLSVNTAAEMTAILKTVITSGTGGGANIGKPAAGKTGTTDSYKDACFVGYTPHIVTGVWVGNDDNTSANIQGGSVPAYIWRDVMKVATEPYGNADFNYPAVELISASNGKIIGGSEDNESSTPANDAEAPDEGEGHIAPNAINPSDVMNALSNTNKPAAGTSEQKPASKPATTVPAPTAAPIPKPAAAPVPTPASTTETLR